MKIFLWVLLLFPGVALAMDFTARVKAGKQALAGAEGQAYEASWGPVMQSTLYACMTPGSKSRENLGEFTFVADVAPSGRVSGVEVEPSTALSRCFVLHFNGAQLPPPPMASGADSLVPVADEIKVTP